MQWLTEKTKSTSEKIAAAALQHQQALTKPAGSLGRLEELAIQLSVLQGRNDPQINKAAIVVFAADHGIAEEGVSAFPQEVTVQMIQNFTEGGAAISVLAKEQNADFQVVNMGTAASVPEHKDMLQVNIDKGTKNFCKTPAMDEEQLNRALDAGKNIIDDLAATKCDLFIGGEMGIANTTSATALACSILNEKPENLVGTGTGVDADGLKRKVDVIRRGLDLHKTILDSPIKSLRCLGGFEIAALTASYVRCAQRGIPVLVDGFICSVAALIAIEINPSVKDWFIFSHESAEVGHKKILAAIPTQPLLNLNMRLGEGSGAATALPLLKLACALHNKMATFSSAEISKKST